MTYLVWIGLGVVLLLAAFFFSMWRRGGRDSVHLTNMIALILLDDEAYRYQRENLIKFIRGAEYRDSVILSGIVSTEVDPGFGTG
jgi:hypothetical protein